MIVACTMALDFGNLDATTRAHALRLRGRALASKNDLDRALADENESIRLDPAVDQAYLTRAFIYRSRNDRAKAFADYDAALRLNPGFARAYLERGWLLGQGGEFGKAIEDFTQAIRVEPSASLAYFYRAQARIRMGDKAGALDDMTAAIRIEPRNRQLLVIRNQMRATEIPAPGSATPATPAEIARQDDGPRNEPAAPSPPPQTASADALSENLNALRHRMDDLVHANKLEEGRRAGEIYVSRVKERFGDRSMPYAEALGLLARIQQSSNNYKEAARNYETELALVERRLDPKKAFVTGAKLNLAQVDQALGRLDEAERLFREVATATEARGGPNDLDLAEALNDLSTVLMKKARYAEAERLVKRAYDIWSKATGDDAQLVNTALMNLASIYQSENRLPEAEDILLRVVAAEEKQGPQAESDLAQALGNLETAYQESGRYAEAEQAGKRSIALFEKIGGPNDPQVAQGLTNIANSYSTERKDHEAELALNRALLIQEKAFGPDSDALATTLYGLGSVMIREGRPAEAAPLMSRGLAIAEKTLGPDNPAVVTILNALAVAVATQGDVEKSDQLLKRALAIEEKLNGPNSPGLAAMLNNLGAHVQAAGRFDEAGALFSRSVAVTRSAASPQPDTLAEGLEALANVKMNQNKPAEAEVSYKEAVAIDRKAFGPDYPRIANVMSRIGVAAEMQKDWRRALNVSRQAYDAAVRSNDRLGKSRQTAAGAAENLAYVSQNLASIDWKASIEDAGQASALKDEAFGAAQRWNVSSAATAVADMAARFGAGNGAMAGVVRQQQDLASQSQVLDKALTQALGSPDANGRDAKVANLRSQIAAVDASLAEVGTRIAHDFPSYAELSDPKPLAIADVQKLLAPDEVLVTWVIRHETIVWAITKEGSAWQAVDLTSKDLKDMVAKLRGSLDLDTVTRGLARGDAGRDVVFDLATAHKLYEKLLAPVAAQLAGKTTIVEVPVGSLTSLPLQVLLTDAPRRSATSMSDSAYRDAPWLAKRHAVTVVPSVSALRALRVFTQASTAPKPLAGFADPVFSRSPTEGGARGTAVAQRKVQVMSHYYRGGAVDLDALRQGLPALPETADELRAVAHDLSADASDLKIGEAASVATVKAMPLDQYRIIYFATHGLVAGDVGGLTEPALALTIPPKPTEADSGLLTASDVSQLKLNADWVVLSACNTAAGDKPGAEGLSGLTRAFFYAGARALLVSNWSVRSDAAVDLTTHTFAQMAATKGLGRSEALRQSMLTLIASGDDHAYPAVWAPFVVVGEGGSGR